MKSRPALSLSVALAIIFLSCVATAQAQQQPAAMATPSTQQQPAPIATPMPGGPQQQSTPTTPVKNFTVYPATAPAAALKYRLLPEPLELTAGNAALLYYQALEHLPQDPIEREKVNNWLDMPFDQLPPNTTEPKPGVPDAFHEAARRDHADWGRRLQEIDISTIMPPLGDLRFLAKLNCVHIRLAIKEGQYEKALHDIQSNFALAHHLTEGHTLVETLVAVSVAKLTMAELEILAQQEETPNLYWALTALPEPFTDMPHTIESERIFVANSFPLLKEAQDRVLSQEEARALWLRVCEFSEVKDDLPAVSTVKTYPHAKQALLDDGYGPEHVEAMPALQTVLLYYWSEYQKTADDMFRWFYVPYEQAKAGMAQEEERFRATRESQKQTMRPNPFLSFLPALSRAYLLACRLDWEIAALRCVEALRLYAAAHEGQLPVALTDIADIAVPVDPMTGEPFIYRIENGKGILESPAPLQYPKEGQRWEVTVKKP